MPNKYTQIREDWKKIQKDLLVIEAEGTKNVDYTRKIVRERVLRGDEINKNDTLGLLLKKEYELETQMDRMDITTELITQGKDIDDPTFKYEVDLRMTRNNLALYDKTQIDGYRKAVREKVLLGEPIAAADVSGKLLAREFEDERVLMRDTLEESFLNQGYDPKSKLFKMEVDLAMLHADMAELDEQKLEQYRQEFNDKKNRGEVFDLTNGYLKLIQREFQLESDITANKEMAEEKKLQEELRQQELNKKTTEATAEATSKAVENALNLDPEPAQPRRGFFARLFRRKPKQEPVAEATVNKETEAAKQETGTEVSNDDKTKETEKKEASKEKEEKKTEKKNPLTEAERRAEEKRKREQHRYRVEFATKELKDEYRNCSDPKILADCLDKATGLSKDAKEHLQNRVLANAKIQSYEESRTIRQKVRPLAVKYKDGTILLKNKKRDVPKQTTMNGCWSAVLSDMLGHFGVNLTQEDIRAYRPEISKDKANSEDAKKLMERLNSDAMNEINDVADLIHRTVPNVAYHHMALSAAKEENKAVFKGQVVDALLNKNSPVALLYGNHYLSVVGIKDNTLIVQNPSPQYKTKYQKLSIDDLFEKCKETGQVNMDWLEDLKFEKDGTCKNTTEQWKNMGITCTGREFKPSDNPNYMTHQKGVEYIDTSRIDQGIQEIIYLPKMSFGLEKQRAEEELKKQQQLNIEQGILTKEQLNQDNLVKEQLEFENVRDQL